MTITFTQGFINTSTSEKTIVDVTADEKLALWIFCQEVEATDTFVVKLYVKDQTGGTTRIYGRETITGVQLKPAKLIPWIPTEQFKVTIQKTVGTNRFFSWMLMELL